MRMRTLPAPAAALLLIACLAGGCANARKAVGTFGEVLQRGITIGGAAAAEGQPAIDATTPRSDLPAGLAGDKDNARYAGPPVTPQ
jgi:hypothetical protein